MRIKGDKEIDEGVIYLCQADAKIYQINSQIDKVPLRLGSPGFAELASIIVSQQVSRASADAIYGRLKSLISPLEPKQFIKAGLECWQRAGLSRPKQRALSALSQAVIEGSLDLEGLCNMAPQEAINQMVAVKGIGPWTAEVYLLFCAGHRDIFPAGDLALQEAVRLGYDLAKRPDEKQLREIAKNWQPWRSVAARMLWEYYRLICKGRDASPL